jgi:hypothetical protein
MLQKLLRKNLSVPQFAGYAFAALTGMSILFAAFCFATDTRPLFASEAELFGQEFMVVNKQVSPVAAFNSELTTFSPTEIDEIRQQDFVRSLAYFSPSRFRVKAYTEASSQMPYFSTDLFFESVPDRLLEIPPAEWKWDAENGMIPIIIPRDYLNLYNFGFSGSQGLPQLSESLVQQVTFKIFLIGNGTRATFAGRIAGFSDHLNTILVPEAFMNWANERFGDQGQAEKISRLILEVKNPADPKITEFFAVRPHYEIGSNKGEQGKLSYFLTLLIMIVMAVGLLILFPAVGLMMLSIHLLIYKNRETLGTLLLLGYGRKQLAIPYCLLALALNILVGLVSLALAGYARSLYGVKLALLGAGADGFGPTVLFAGAFVLVVTLLDVMWIRRNIRNITVPALG